LEAAHRLKVLAQYLWYICKLEVNTDKVGITHHKKMAIALGGIRSRDITILMSNGIRREVGELEELL
jgi:hypothetical protein